MVVATTLIVIIVEIVYIYIYIYSNSRVVEDLQFKNNISKIMYTISHREHVI